MVSKMEKDIELINKSRWTYEQIREDVINGLSVNDIIGKRNCSSWPIYEVRKELRSANHRTKIQENN